MPTHFCYKNKWKHVYKLRANSVPKLSLTFLWFNAVWLARFLCPWISQAKILEWVAISFSSRSCPPRGQTHISCIVGRFFTAEPPGKPVCMLPGLLFLLLLLYLGIQALTWKGHQSSPPSEVLIDSVRSSID